MPCCALHAMAVVLEIWRTRHLEAEAEKLRSVNKFPFQNVAKLLEHELSLATKHRLAIYPEFLT